MRRAQRGRIGRTVAAGVLVAAASGFAACRDASWTAPPRYDGAGYAVLARALLEGRGYRAIDHPDRPRHAHFPPGYPALLAATWRVTGVSATAARGVSVLCTAGATLLAWCWFRRMMPSASALMLALALALNWQWARNGAAIQSEPAYMLLGQLAILAAARGAPAVVLGTLLAACLLTRHVAVGLALAILIDLALRRRWRRAILVATSAVLLVAPWLIWMASAAEARTQAGLVLGAHVGWRERVSGQLVFYVRRIPDQIVGPFVEVGTVFRGPGWTATTANLWAMAATGIVVLGWIRGLAHPRRRLAGLVPLSTLALLLVWPYTEAGRFLVPLIPCLLIGSVEGVAGLWRWGRLSRRRLVAAGLVLAATLPYSAYYLAAGKARAAEGLQRDFDEACAWLARESGHPGPVLTRHPGEVFWQTGRQALEVATSERPGDVDAGAEAIARTIVRYGVAYLLIDRERYANAMASPLERFVERFPGRVRAVWSREEGSSSVTIYEVRPSR